MRTTTSTVPVSDSRTSATSFNSDFSLSFNTPTASVRNIPESVGKVISALVIGAATATLATSNARSTAGRRRLTVIVSPNVLGCSSG